MAFGQGLLNNAQQRIIVTVAIALMSLSFIPFVPQVVSDFLNWQLGNTEFTVGAVLGLIGLYAAFQIHPSVRKL